MYAILAVEGKVEGGFDVPGVSGCPLFSVQMGNCGNGLGNKERMTGLEVDFDPPIRELENERELFGGYARLGSDEGDQEL